MNAYYSIKSRKLFDQCLTHMASLKLLLRNKPKKDGSKPLVLQIIKNRKSSIISTGYYCKDKDWDALTQRVKKSHPNYVRLNNFLIKKLSEATDNALELETNNVEVNARAIRHRIKPSGTTTFFGQAQLYLDRLEQAGKYNQRTADKPRVKHFREFIGHDISFQDITQLMLERFKGFLKTKYDLSERSIVNHLVMVRTVFSQAVKDKIVDVKHYPFGKGKIKIKFPDSHKIGLTAQEVKTLQQGQLEGKFNHARNVWLISFYFAGMRISDVLRLRWSDFQNDRLHYSMGKNNKGGSLKIPTKAIAILEQYKLIQDGKDDFIFPELKQCDFSNRFITERTIAFKASALDKILRKHVAPQLGIEKKLTMHIARHTFGNISGDKIPIQMLQKLYRHSSIITTIGYQQNFIYKAADDALDAVIDF